MRGDFSRWTFRRDRHVRSVRQQQGRVFLDADWNEQQEVDDHLRRTALRDLLGPAAWPVGAAGFGVTPVGEDLRLSAGRCWVDGVLVENEAEVALGDQPELPSRCPRVRLAGGVDLPAGEPAPPGTYLVHLDVWSRLVTAVEDPSLLEPALGGVDTAVRVRTTWQVRLAQVGSEVDDLDDVPLPAWAVRPRSTGTLAVWREPGAGGTDNRTYRVEVHEGGGPGTATFVWSRENGSVLAGWDRTDEAVLSLRGSAARAGRFEGAALVELTDETRELTGRAGVLVRPRAAHVDRVELDPARTPEEADRSRFDERPRLRRWDGAGTVPADGGPVEIEHGVRVRFGSADAHYVSGDAWCFATRQASAGVDWPQRGNGPAAEPPQEPRHAHARLALVRRDADRWTVLRDLRPFFAPLTGGAEPPRPGGRSRPGRA